VEQIDRFDDWWEHDGLIFPARFNALALGDILRASAAAIAELCSDDDHVCAGFAPRSRDWYLRVRLEQRDPEIVGHFDIFAAARLSTPLSIALNSTIAVAVRPHDLLSQIRLP
jgi:hypothetical protein